MNMPTVPSDQLKAMQQEIADLKEQITNAKYNYLGAMGDCKRYEETIAQQAAVIEQMRDVFKAASGDAQRTSSGAGRLFARSRWSDELGQRRAP